MRETARPPRHRANRRGDTWNAYAMVNGDLPALGSLSDLAGLGQPGGCPKTKPGANQRRQAGLPCRLPDLLLKRPDRRLRVAGVPQAKRAKPFGAVPSSGGRDRQSGAGGAEPKTRDGTNGTGRHRAGRRGAGGTSYPYLWAADVASTGSDAAAPRLRHGLPNLLQ